MTTKTEVRLDIWLWSSRFYKSRKLATDAIKGGHIWVNGNRAKPAKAVRIDDQLRIRKFPHEFIVDIKGLSEKRLGAPLARELYEELPESILNREEKQLLFKSNNMGIQHARKRPSGRDRKKMLAVKNQTPFIE